MDQAQEKTLDRCMKWEAGNGMAQDECELPGSSDVKRAEPEVECEAASSRSSTHRRTTRRLRERSEVGRGNRAALLTQADVDGVEEAGERVEVSLTDGRSLGCSLLVDTAC